MRSAFPTESPAAFREPPVVSRIPETWKLPVFLNPLDDLNGAGTHENYDSSSTSVSLFYFNSRLRGWRCSGSLGESRSAGGGFLKRSRQDRRGSKRGPI